MARNFSGTNSFLAERLRQARLQAGYSQQNIADALNVNRATYTYYETGKTSPDPVTLGKIARICGVLRNAGVIRVKKRRMEILVPDQLQQLASFQGFGK